MRRWTSGLVLALAIAGCDDASEGDGGGGATDAPSSREFFEQRIAADCDREVRCEAAAESAQDCATRRIAEARVQLDRFIGGTQDGSIAYDGASATTCLAKIGGACSLDLVTDILPPCNAVLEGTLAVDAACFAHVQCGEQGGAAGLCFAGCAGLFGDEEPLGVGACVQRSPIGTAACP